MQIAGFFNVQLSAATINWQASNDPNLLEYELRMSPGPNFDEDTATVVGNIPPGTLSFTTAAGLANPGDTASHKLFVRLTTGNEAGCNTVTITPP